MEAAMADRRRPSTTQTALRRRLRERTSKLEDMVTEDIAELYKPIEEWDWEELSRGMPRREDGTFQRGKPSWITPAIQAEARRRMRAMTEDELMVHARDAISVLKELMTDHEVDDFGKPIVSASVKLQAAQYVLNHVIGTPKARVEIEQSNPISELMADVLVNPDGEASHMVIEGEVASEEDGEDEDG